MVITEAGRPKDVTGRLQKEVRAYDLLDSLQIEYERADHEAAMTMEACLEIDEALKVKMCKNLLLCNSQKTKFYLLCMPGDKKFKTKEISSQINSARLSFADGTFMEEFLDITPGSLSILGLMNDKENRVQLILDQDTVGEEYFGCHPLINTSSLRIKTRDILEKFLPAVHHEPIVVTLLGED